MLALALALALAAPPPVVHVRLNQVGYRPGDPKIAFALTNQDLATRGFEVRARAGDAVVLRGKVGRDRGRYGSFAHVYELDFTPLVAKGDYVLRVGGMDSPAFTVAADAHGELLAKSLSFFRVQRCGGDDPQGHGPCHLQDGIARGGPTEGTRVRADGGWHDAGDYIKFLITAGYATNLLLATYVRHPEAFPDDDADHVPDVLEEATVGLAWMEKLWDASKGVLYYQVSDASDHGRWRLPEQDRDARPVWACEPGRGANVAGKAAASLALAAVIWNDRGRPYFDAGRAGNYLAAARQIYAYGKERPEAQPSNPPEFYGERSSADNMALAAAALYRATGEPAYLREARDFARAAGMPRGFSWSESHASAHYEIARIDPSYVAEASRHLETSLEAARGFAEADPFRVGLQRLHWGSAPVMLGVALQAFWYRDLTGDGRYLPLGQAQWDYLLGANPWGVCFVNGAGTTWSRLPHHQIADLTRTQLTGFWNEGPVPLSVFQGRKITLSGPDANAAFQSEGAVYHDDKEDYVTNEPTLTANATGMSLTAWYMATATPAAAGAATRRPATSSSGPRS
jgi:endoglucanase